MYCIGEVISKSFMSINKGRFIINAEQSKTDFFTPNWHCTRNSFNILKHKRKHMTPMCMPEKLMTCLPTPKNTWPPSGINIEPSLSLHACSKYTLGYTLYNMYIVVFKTNLKFQDYKNISYCIRIKDTNLYGYDTKCDVVTILLIGCTV